MGYCKGCGKKKKKNSQYFRTVEKNKFPEENNTKMSDHNPRLLLGYWYGFSFPEQKPAVAWEGHVRYADITYVINRIGSF